MGTTLDVYRALWRHRFFIAILTAVLAAATWLIVSHQTRIYQASSMVRVQQKIQNASEAFGALETGQRLAQTYAQIVGTRELSDRVYTMLAIPRQQRDVKISGSAVQQLDLLRINARSKDPQLASRAANAAPVALQRFIDQTGTLRDQVTLVDEATVPQSPVSPRVKLLVALAVVLGLIFNGALALLIELLSDRLPDVEHLEATLGRPVLAVIPTLKLGMTNPAESPLLGRAPQRPAPAPTSPRTEPQERANVS